MDTRIYKYKRFYMKKEGGGISYLQELVMSDEFDGYVVNRLNSTTYGDVSEILNILILSRLMNKSFIDKMLTVLAGSNILAYFTRSKNKVDGDYSQLISINSIQLNLNSIIFLILCN